jgi:hypothetical protein
MRFGCRLFRYLAPRAPKRNHKATAERIEHTHFRTVTCPKVANLAAHRQKGKTQEDLRMCFGTILVYRRGSRNLVATFLEELQDYSAYVDGDIAVPVMDGYGGSMLCDRVGYW